MRVITICSRPLDDDSDLSDSRQPYMMRQSIARFQIPLEVKIMPFDHGGWSHVPWMEAELARMERDEIVLFTDCWDAFFAGTMAEIEQEFLRFDAGIVHSAQCWIWPEDDRLRDAYPQSPTQYRYINGGGIIGYAGALLDRYNHREFWDWPRVQLNQQAYHEWLLRHPDSVAVDRHCRIFQVVEHGERLKVRGERLHNLETGSQPLLIHGPGGNARHVAAIWERLKQSWLPPQARIRGDRVQRLRDVRRHTLTRR